MLVGGVVGALGGAAFIFRRFKSSVGAVWAECLLSRGFVLTSGGTEPLLCLPDWRWTQRKRQPDSYFSVLRAFMDRKDSYYSIHQIGGGAEHGAWPIGMGSGCPRGLTGVWAA